MTSLLFVSAASLADMSHFSTSSYASLIIMMFVSKDLDDT